MDERLSNLFSLCNGLLGKPLLGPESDRDGEGLVMSVDEMIEKFYVVSESELLELKLAATIDGCCYSDESRDVDEALAACRARPISEEIALFLGLPSKYDLETKILKDAGD